MHGRTFNTDIIGQTATVWNVNSNHHGRCGKIIAKKGIGKLGKGTVTTKFIDGSTSTDPYDTVALGDNSVR